ncbi:hypothetical protein [Paenibacillus gorillae]|uniref:hypothetical protein n=1 Tax=Paenibacillus gorillae TaxID=1243662 RepID=UPI0004AE78B6|nr:hypothetical protein [Paenibacillus gorillae]
MSKKLEGNGRWESSRMMLPEHREQYLQRRAPQDGKPVQVPLKEELEFIRDFVLLPMMLDIVEKNRRDIELSSYTMKTLFIRASFAVIKLIENELAAVRKELKMRKIQVFQDELESEGGAIHYRFVCRGYEDRFSMIRDAARAEISVRIARYIAKVCK